MLFRSHHLRAVGRGENKTILPGEKLEAEELLISFTAAEAEEPSHKAYNALFETYSETVAERMKAHQLPGAPAGVPDSFEEHVKLMFDLQVLAFMSDTTRVFSFKLGRDGSGRVYPGSGVSTGFHNASHHGAAEATIRAFGEINKHHVSMLPYFLEKLQAAKEGDATLLDKTLIMYGSPMSNGNVHNHRNLPFIMVGGGNGTNPGQLHVKAADDTPIANVMLTMLHRLGVNDVKTFGDSTGEFSFATA